MKKILFVSFALLLATATMSQTFDEYKKKRQEEMAQMKKERDEGIQKLKDEYRSYVEKHDKEFAAYLEKEWKAFNLFKANQRKKEPKPDVIPEYVPPKPDKPAIEKPKPEQTPEEQPDDQPEKPTPQPKPVPDKPFNKQLNPFGMVPVRLPEKDPEVIKPVIQKSVPTDFNFDVVTVSYYGNEFAFEVDPDLKTFRPGAVNDEAFSKAWTSLSEMQYAKVIRQAYDYKNDYNLNDWGYYLLIKKTAEELTYNENARKILTWFLMNRSGYNTKIAYAGNEVALLLPSTVQIYKWRYLTIDGQKFYMVDQMNATQLYTYEEDYPLAHKTMDFYIHAPLLLGEKTNYRKVSFDYKGQPYQFDIAYNPNQIAFFNDYPLTDISVYLNAPVSDVLKKSVTKELLPVLSKMDEENSINFLLAFIQKGFEYKTDDAQFGYEKFFFPEEIMHYPYCDCEDRSAFLAYMVDDLLDMEVVGLDYPGHLATAVKFTEDVSGDFVMVGHKKFTVADPTYINAPFGLTMPQFSDKPVKIVALKPDELMLAGKYWAITNNANGFRGGGGKDYVFDKDDNCYLTGFYADKLQFDGLQLDGNANKQAFIAKFSPEGKVIWAANMRNVSDDAFSMANSIVLDENNRPLIAGIYSGEVAYGSHRVSNNGKAGIFIAKMGRQRYPEWLKNIPLNEGEAGRHFAATFSLSGDLLEQEVFPEEDVVDTEEGLFAFKDKILLTGSLSGLPAIDETSYADVSAIDHVAELKKVNDELISSQVHPSIAGLFAVTQLIQNNGFVIPGAAAQAALMKYNPDFSKKYPEMFENIGKVRFMKNQEGIVTILSDNKKSVKFEQVKVSNDARMRVIPLSDGNQKIEVINGIEVGKLFVWFDLNYVKLFKENGDMLFDYDDDHSHARVNITDDILN